MAGFGVGIVLLAIILAIGPATVAAVNPARALGPAVASGNLIGQAIYWIGPILGAIDRGATLGAGALKEVRSEE